MEGLRTFVDSELDFELQCLFYGNKKINISCFLNPDSPAVPSLDWFLPGCC